MTLLSCRTNDDGEPGGSVYIARAGTHTQLVDEVLVSLRVRPVAQGCAREALILQLAATWNAPRLEENVIPAMVIGGGSEHLRAHRPHRERKSSYCRALSTGDRGRDASTIDASSSNNGPVVKTRWHGSVNLTFRLT